MSVVENVIMEDIRNGFNTIKDIKDRSCYMKGFQKSNILEPCIKGHLRD